MKTRVYSAVLMCVFSLLYGAVVIKVYIDDKRKLKQQIEPSFVKAIEEDLKMRFDMGHAYYYYSYDPTKRESGLSISSIMDEQFHMLHSALREENPIDVNTLDSLFAKQLKGKGCTGPTGVEYIDHSSNVTQRSGNNPHIYLSGDHTKRLPIGYDSEMSLQGFVRITPISVIRSAKEHYFFFVLIYLFSLLSITSVINIRKRRNAAKTVKSEGDKRTITFDSQKKTLKDGQNGQVSLTTQQALLIDYMLNAENHYISNEEMKQLLWNTTDFIGTSRQYQSIDRLRKKLESIPEIKIVNEHRHGYSLTIEETVDFSYTKKADEGDLHLLESIDR